MAGLSVSETADALKLTESNVKVRLNRARAMLRRQIENSYSASDIFEFNAKFCDAMVHNVRLSKNLYPHEVYNFKG